MPEPITSASTSRSKRATRVCILARKKLSRNTRIFKQAKALSQAGYDVTIIAIREEGLPSYEEREHWRIHRINLVTLNNVLFPLRFHSILLRFLLALLPLRFRSKLVRSFLPRKLMGGGRRSAGAAPSAEHAHPVSGHDGQVLVRRWPCRLRRLERRSRRHVFGF